MAATETEAKLDRVLARFAELDSKLDDMMGILENCSAGISFLKDEEKHSVTTSNNPYGRSPHRKMSGNSYASAHSDLTGNLSKAGPQWETEHASEAKLNFWIPPPPPECPAGFAHGFSDSAMSGTGSAALGTDSEEPDTPSSRDKLGHAFSLRRLNRSQMTTKVWAFLGDSDSSRLAQIWARWWNRAVLASVMVTLVQLARPTPLRGISAAILEAIIEVAFGVELLMRFLTCPDRRSFVKSPLNIIDFISATPLAFRAVVGFVLPDALPAVTDGGDVVHFGLLCFVPVIRLLKALRRNRVQLKLFESVLVSTIETLQFLGFVATLVITMSASLLYMVEPRDNVETYWMAVWLTIVTMTTVGYGDVTPVTTIGRCVTLALILCSVLFMALPIGVLGNAFAAVWKDRDLVLLIDKTRQRLAQWGYTTDDVPILFKRFSSDGSGELAIADFAVMLKEFRVDLSDERVVELFAIFDNDNGGTIDDREFLRVVFPRTWHQMVQAEKEEEEREKEREKERQAQQERARRERRRQSRRARTSDTSHSQSGGLLRGFSGQVRSQRSSGASANPPVAIEEAWPSKSPTNATGVPRPSSSAQASMRIDVDVVSAGRPSEGGSRPGFTEHPSEMKVVDVATDSMALRDF